MIYLYSGTPGSGKSLHVASIIYWRLKNNRPVICNFDINYDKIPGRNVGEFCFCDNLELCPDILMDYSREYFGNKKAVKEGTITLVIDECQILFNSRDWNQKNRNAWLSFFTQHRKFGYDIILVAQFDRMIDRQIRALIEYEFIHRKVSNFGTAGKIMSLVALGNLFVAVKVWYPLKEKVGSEFFRAKRRYYSLYDTFMMFDAPDDGKVSTTQGKDAPALPVVPAR